MSRDEMNNLLDQALPFAMRMLEKSGEFYPYAIVLKRDGKFTAVAAEPGAENPDSRRLIERLLDGLQEGAERGEYRATALCFEVVLRDLQKDAIAVSLEHLDGEAVTVYLPYERQEEGKYLFGDTISFPAEPAVFGSPLSE
jgi:hypothetical protein